MFLDGERGSNTIEVLEERKITNRGRVWEDVGLEKGSPRPDLQKPKGGWQKKRGDDHALYEKAAHPAWKKKAHPLRTRGSSQGKSGKNPLRKGGSPHRVRKKNLAVG